MRVPYGFWEAKDEEDDLDAEIQKKFRRGYPQDNIVFEDSRKAVLIQNRQEIMRCPVDDPDRLEKLLDLFFSHERPEIAEFRKAVEQFKADLPAVLAALRGMIERSEATSPEFRAAALRFLKTRAGDDQPERHRRRCARDADPAHPDRGDLLHTSSTTPIFTGRTMSRANFTGWKRRFSLGP